MSWRREEEEREVDRLLDIRQIDLELSRNVSSVDEDLQERESKSEREREQQRDERSAERWSGERRRRDQKEDKTST